MKSKPMVMAVIELVLYKETVYVVFEGGNTYAWDM